MGEEIDLLINYPKTKRNIEERAESKTEEDRLIARRFGKEFFDGERKHGYGGFNYHPRFWQPVIPTFQKKYQLTSKSKVLDIGAAKGFMLYDFMHIIPGIQVAGIDISPYAIENAKEEVRPFLKVANATLLPYEDNFFDLVIAINTLHNLEEKEFLIALKEMMRVSKKYAFLTVDAYRNEREKELMFGWNLTAKTILHVDEWKRLFNKANYKGDYYWFMP